MLAPNSMLKGIHDLWDTIWDGDVGVQRNWAKFVLQYLEDGIKDYRKNHPTYIQVFLPSVTILGELAAFLEEWGLVYGEAEHARTCGHRHHHLAMVVVEDVDWLMAGTDWVRVCGRRSLRKSWMPVDQQRLQRLEDATGSTFMFVIGIANNKAKMAELQ
ncbi:hypothetical protein AAG906_018966 [Vitis piasezkii]